MSICPSNNGCIVILLICVTVWAISLTYLSSKQGIDCNFTHLHYRTVHFIFCLYYKQWIFSNLFIYVTVDGISITYLSTRQLINVLLICVTIWGIYFIYIFAPQTRHRLCFHLFVTLRSVKCELIQSGTSLKGN